MRQLTTYLKYVLAFVVILLAAPGVYAQNGTANLQIIHNSPDPAVSSVDIYVNGDLFLRDVNFRDATAFDEVPAGADLDIEIAPLGEGIENAVGPFTFNLTEDENYILVASGVVDESAFEDAEGFSLEAFTPARQEAEDAGTVDVNIMHGSPDAPDVDIHLVQPGDTRIFLSEVSYPDFSGYEEFDPVNTILGISGVGGEILLEFSAPLADLDLEGSALNVLASGFFNEENAGDDNAFGLLAVLRDGTTLMLEASEPQIERSVSFRGQALDLTADDTEVVVEGLTTMEDDLLVITTNPADGDFVGAEIVGFTEVGAMEDGSVAVDVSGADPVDHVAHVLSGVSEESLSDGVVSEETLGFVLATSDAAPVYALAAFEWSDQTFSGSASSVTIDEIQILYNGELGESLFSIDLHEVEDGQIGAFVGVAQMDLEFNEEYSGVEVDVVEPVDPADDNPVRVDAQITETGEYFAMTHLGPAGTDADGNRIPAQTPGLLTNQGDGTNLRPLIGDFATVTIEPALANLQIIHNSPDPAVSSVDIYVNGDEFLSGVDFRDATAFDEVPAGVELEIQIAPADAGFENAVGPFTFTLEEDENYILVASGVVDEDSFSGAEGFSLEAYAPGRMEAEDASLTDVNIMHGSPDAPAVDIYLEQTGADRPAVSELAFPDFTGYVSLEPMNETVGIAGAGGDVLVEFAAPFADLGLEGAALSVLASGFFDDDNAGEDNAFGLLAVLPDGTTLMLDVIEPEPEPEFARAQIIHNAADPAAEVVDIYVNGDLFADSLAFRAATPFVDVPAGTGLDIEIYPYGADAGDTDAAYTLEGAEFDADETYTIIANGVLGDGFAENPDDISVNFDLFVVADTKESHDDGNETSLFVWHGATDAPSVDVQIRNDPPVVTDLAYSESTDYLDVPAADYILDISPEGTGDVIASFKAPLAEAGGQAIAVLASGFLDPSNNNDGPAFGLLAVFADGTTLELPAADLPEDLFSVTFNVDMSQADDFDPDSYDVYIGGSLAGDWTQPGSDPEFRMEPVEEGSDIYTITLHLEEGDYEYKYFLIDDEPDWDMGEWPGDPNRSVSVTGDMEVNDIFGVQPDEMVARAQIIHNAADPAAASVDIYVNGELFVDELSFREATPYVDVPANTALDIAIYPAGADAGETDPVFSLEGAEFALGETYSVIANGVLGDGFAANPDGVETDFNLFIVEDAQEDASEEDVSFFIWHGATDAPAVDVWVADGPALAEGAAYTDATGIITVEAMMYTLNLGVEGSADTGDALFEFAADLSGAAGSGAAVLASGFLDPSANEDGEEFGLLVVLPDGTTLLLEAVDTSTEQHLSDRPETFRLEQNYPNPFNPTTKIEFSIPESSDVTLEVFNVQGQRVATLVNESRSAGVHTVEFDATNLSSGVYLYRIQAGDFTQVNKMMLVK